GMEIKLEVNRKESKKTETIKLTLGVLSEIVPDKLAGEATRRKALAAKKTAPASPPAPGKPRPVGPRQPPAPKKEQEKKDDKKDEQKKPETGLLKRATQARDHEYWVYVPEDYDPNIAYALVIWLHPAGKGKDKDTENMISAWDDFCSDNHIIL